MTAINFLADRDSIGPIDDFMRGFVDDGKSAGMSTMICQHGQCLHYAGYGQADIEAGVPIRDDTLFRIYSMTKPITSAALMTLYEKGRFQLDDAARQWIPALGSLRVYPDDALQSDITMRQLLTHTAGFGYGLYPESNEVERRFAEIWRRPNHHRRLSEVIAEVLELPLIAQPGSRWQYSIATDICGYLVELISDMPFADYLRQTLFDPLGMTDTGFSLPAHKAPRLASLYGYREDNPMSLLEKAADSPLIDRGGVEGVRLHSGGGGLISSAQDYRRFAQMMLQRGQWRNQTILKAETVALMTRNQISESLLPLHFNGVAAGDYRGYGFGLGYCVNIDPSQTAAAGSRGDFAWGGLADTYCWVDPSKQLVAILMQQFMPSLHHAGRKQFRDAVYRVID